jgi:hypothetical protein
MCRTGLAAAAYGAALVVCLEERDGPRALLIARLAESTLGNVVVWAGADGGEPWDATWGEVDVVVGDGFVAPSYTDASLIARSCLHSHAMLCSDDYLCFLNHKQSLKMFSLHRFLSLRILTN